MPLRAIVMVLNATFNNTSVISWRKVLLVEETEYMEKIKDLSQVMLMPVSSIWTQLSYHLRLWSEVVELPEVIVCACTEAPLSGSSYPFAQPEVA